MKRSTYVRIWEFEAAPERRAEFEEVYGATGDWAALFREYEGWVATRLYVREGVYRSLDEWSDAAAWRAARAACADRYAELDAECEALTQREAEVYEGADARRARGLLADWTEVFPAGLGDDEALALDGELDLHRFPPQQVKELVRSYVEECRAAGVLSLRIVHGKGIGRQREIVHRVLQDMPEAVAEYSLAPEGRGSWGATLVRLRPAGS